MISPGELRIKLAGNYRKFLKNIITGNSMFPYRPRVNLELDNSNHAEAVRQIHSLEKESKSNRGFGYIIQYRTIHTRKYGEQTSPESLIFETPEDFFRFIGKESEATAFLQAVEATRNTLPIPDRWMRDNCQIILRYLNAWSDIITTVKQLQVLQIDPDLSQLNRRSLPITLNTKFIEQNKSPIQKILEEIGGDAIDLDSPVYSSEFLVWIRFHESPHSFYNANLGIFPIEEFTEMDFPAGRILIIENKASFIHPIPGKIISILDKEPAQSTLLIWGQGNACQRLKDVNWLQKRTVYYWGDMDLHGLAILGRFRKSFSHTRSVAMNLNTYRLHTQFAVPGKSLDRGSWYDYLNRDEKELVEYLIEHPEKSRVEQERVR